MELTSDDDVVHVVHLFREVCAHAKSIVGDVHIVGEAALTQVQVHANHSLAGLSAGERKVERQETLALAGSGGCEL